MPLLIEDDAFTVDLLRLEASAVGEVRRDLRVAPDRGGKVDDDAVLPDDAQIEQPSVFLGRHAADGERFCEPQRHRRERDRADPDPELRGALDPHPIGAEGDVEIVAENVIFDELVLAVEPAPDAEFLWRRVDRDVPAALAIEERDVLGVLHDAHT